ncbi:MAG: endonuclease/exonuclease/phosphatase family protein [Planctomycetota bacterium]|jgi:endonuclease/exonuclease/phosphatase family metal-dependent hydrolase
MTRKAALSYLSLFVLVAAGATVGIGYVVSNAPADPLPTDEPSTTASVPPSESTTTASPDTVRIAFWNIRDLSVDSRDATEREKIAGVLSQFDAVAICEVNDSEILPALEGILDEECEWSSVTSAKVGRSSGTAEHYGVLWKETVFDLVLQNNLPDVRLGDLDIGVDELGVDPDTMFDREPYMVHLKTDDGRLDFAYVIVHVTWGTSGVWPRIAEVRALSHYYETVSATEKDVLIVGDFNRNAGDAKSLGWLSEKIELTDTTDGTVPTHVSGTSTYDHILVHPSHTTEYTGTHGVVLFDETVFDNDDDAAKLAGSDHRPVWIELGVTTDDD